MLTLKKIAVTVGAVAQAMTAARYPLEPADSPQAFAHDGDAEGAARANAVWVGSETALGWLGLVRGAEVTAEPLALALQGLHTETGAEVRRPGYKKVPVLEDGKAVVDAENEPLTTTEPQVNSVDLTFSAPKSVSVLWSQAPSPLRREIEQAMFDAANAMVDYMVRTKRVVQTKPTAELAIGFAASAALHVTARTARGDIAPAPQLHVHCTLVGVESAARDRLRTPTTEALFKHDAPLAGGAFARAVLAERLREIGFGIEPGTGPDRMYFEIAGVPQGLIDRMSPRAREVERERIRRELAAGRPLTGAALAVIALETRSAKADVPAGVTIEQWRAQAQEFEFGQAQVEALTRGDGPRLDPGEIHAAARAEILERIRKRGPTVSRGEAEAIAYAVAPMGLTVEAALGVLHDLEARGDLIALDVGPEADVPAAERGGPVRVTSREIRSMEERVMRTASGAVARTSEPLSARARALGKHAADRALGPGEALDLEQEVAFVALTAGRGWATLTGRAGTGKGPVLQAVAEAHRTDGWQVIACAVDNATARRLGHQIGAEALTIEKIMVRQGRDSLGVDARTLILIEEASKVGLADWDRIAALVEDHGVRVVAVGHAGQLGAIELPGMFAEMLRDQTIPTLELSQIRRHRHGWMCDYNVALDTGTPEHAAHALELLRNNGALGLYDTRIEAMGAMIDDWNRYRVRYQDPRSAIMIVHGSNDDVDLVNELAQRCRLEAGNELSRPGINAIDRSYALYAGDVVMMCEAAYEVEGRRGAGRRPRVENGTVGVVESVDPKADRVWVRFSEPGAGERRVPIDLGWLRTKSAERTASLRLAYAYHPYTIQGASVEAAFVLEGHWSQRKEATYVADTRMRELLRKYVDRESLGTELSDEERWGVYVERVRTSQNRSASIKLAISDERIAPVLPGLTRAPELPTRSEYLELGEDRGDDEPLARAPSRDSIEAYRSVLGRERTRQLDARARALEDWLASRDEAWLHARRVELGEPFEKLELRATRDAMRLSLRLERSRRILGGRAREALRQAAELEAHAAALPELRHARARRNLLAEARIRRELAGEDATELARIASSESRLHAEGLHPDAWMEENGERAARLVALERALASREVEGEVGRPDRERRPAGRDSSVEPSRPTVDVSR